MDPSALERRKAQNLTASRPDARSVTPSTRSFALAIDRQREGVERIPVFAAARPGLVEAALALDDAEVAALALSLDDVAAELAEFSEVARAVSVPVLRCDLVLEEFQIYETRLAGADAVLLVARFLPGEQLGRLTRLAHGTHLSTCVLCENEAELDRAHAARASVLALPLRADGTPDGALWSRVPRRTLVLALPRGPWTAGAAPAAPAPSPLDLTPLRGRCDAALDPALAAASDPASAFRAALAQD